MATSRLAAVRAALKSDISAQLTSDGVTSVKVRQFEPTADDRDRTDTVYFKGRIEIDQEHLAYGGSRVETIDFEGGVVAFKSGGTEDEAIEAETRALAIFASVENAVRADHQVSGTVFHAQINGNTVTTAPDDQGFVSFIEFSISVESHI